MSVPATGLEALYSAAAVDMLAACTAWWVPTGAADATEARAFIVEDWAGNTEGALRAVDGQELDTKHAWAAVRSQGMRPRTVAAWTVVHEGDILFALHLPPTDGDDPASALRRLRNLSSAIVEEMRAQIGTAGKPLWAEFEFGPSTVTAVTSQGGNEVETTITMRWSETL